MDFQTLINTLIEETTQTSLPLFAPELALCGTIIALLFGRLFGVDRRLPPYWIALIGTLASFGLAYYQFVEMRGIGGGDPTPFFTGLLVYDPFTVFFRLFLLLFLILVIALTVLSGIPDREDGPDFYTLLVGATIGMMLMVSANNLLILFLGIEMTSVPSYAMVGFLKGRRLSSEASLKFVVYGAGAAGVMLYGISLLAGLLGTADLTEMAARLQLVFAGDAAQAGVSDPMVRTVVLALVMVLVGLAFKLSLVPFHFWAPDAFEGASAEVAGFLSVASKAAAFALLVRFTLAFAGGDPGALRETYFHLGIGLGVMAAVTATFGNLAAYAQTNVKRLLAYSTIAHAGYMLMAVAAMTVVLNVDPASEFYAAYGADGVKGLAQESVEALLFYLAVYLFMNLGAFAIVALIRNQIFSEEIDDYDGLARQAPVLCIGMLLCMFSLIGLPPLGGFVAKFFIFASLFEAGKAHWMMWAILAIAAINTVFSLFYYMRVLKAMFLNTRPEKARRIDVPLGSAPGLYVLMVSAPLLLFGVVGRFIQGLSQTAGDVAAVIIPIVRDIP